MTNHDDVPRRILAFEVPPEIASATKAAAVKDMCTMSYICRRALLKDLKERGFLSNLEVA